ncbi:hypothetical protein EV426DRAFT_585308 [Tirmania nivea]|nr:hypothetical protein EV426DRAFT_585308 [Tirmania nivea]
MINRVPSFITRFYHSIKPAPLQPFYIGTVAQVLAIPVTLSAPLMNTIPEVTSNTHVMAILGVTDPDPGEGDGWLLADFCLLNQLLRDTGKTQSWFMAMNVDEAIVDHGDIVHGNPFRERKVVCSRRNPLHDVTECAVEDIRNAFLQQLRAVCRTCQTSDKLLLVMVGHGEEETYGLCIGEEEREEVLLRSEVDEITNAYLPAGTNVAIILTSCYSGGWLSVDSSVMAAVSKDHESDSYQRSASECLRGGLFTQALINTLCAGITTSSYRKVTDDVTAHLERIFALVVEDHPPVYSAQANQWDQDASSMTGLKRVQEH